MTPITFKLVFYPHNCIKELNGAHVGVFSFNQGFQLSALQFFCEVSSQVDNSRTHVQNIPAWINKPVRMRYEEKLVYD